MKEVRHALLKTHPFWKVSSTHYIDFFDFYISLDLSTIYLDHFSGC